MRTIAISYYFSVENILTLIFSVENKKDDADVIDEELTLLFLLFLKVGYFYLI